MLDGLAIAIVVTNGHGEGKNGTSQLTNQLFRIYVEVIKQLPAFMYTAYCFCGKILLYEPPIPQDK